ELAAVFVSRDCTKHCRDLGLDAVVCVDRLRAHVDQELPLDPTRMHLLREVIRQQPRSEPGVRERRGRNADPAPVVIERARRFGRHTIDYARGRWRGPAYARARFRFTLCSASPRTTEHARPVAVAFSCFL